MEITHLNEIASQLKFKFPYSMERWANLGYPVENYHKHTTWSNFFQIDSCTTIPQFSDMVQKRNGTLLFSGEHGFQGEWLKVYDYCKNIPLNFRSGRFPDCSVWPYIHGNGTDYPFCRKNPNILHPVRICYNCIFRGQVHIHSCHRD